MTINAIDSKPNIEIAKHGFIESHKDPGPVKVLQPEQQSHTGQPTRLRCVSLCESISAYVFYTKCLKWK